MTKIPSGLYLLTDPDLTAKEGVVAAVAAAIQGGVKMVQYRNKRASRSERLWEIRDLITLCRPLGVPLIINDEPALAAEVGADGVHLGRDDPPLEEARQILGKEAIIGISCYNSLDLAREGEARGADYVAFGRFFPSKTKPEAVHATPALLRQARAELSLPLVAIGGINAKNSKALVAAGADLLAVIHAVLGRSDIQHSAAAIAAHYQPQEEPLT